MAGPRLRATASLILAFAVRASLSLQSLGQRRLDRGERRWRDCGEGAREGDVFVRLYCGDDSGDVHTSCQPAWREAEEARARAALGLGPLTGLFDRHFPLLDDIEEVRPHDVNDA